MTNICDDQFQLAGYFKDNDNGNDEDEDLGSFNGDDGDLYIIGAVCLSVCVSQKSLFLYSKDLVISYVSRHFPFSKVSGNRKNDQIP